MAARVCWGCTVLSTCTNPAPPPDSLSQVPVVALAALGLSRIDMLLPHWWETGSGCANGDQGVLVIDYLPTVVPVVACGTFFEPCE